MKQRGDSPRAQYPSDPLLLIEVRFRPYSRVRAVAGGPSKDDCPASASQHRLCGALRSRAFSASASNELA